MKELARISLTKTDGKPLGLPAILIGPVEHASQDGSVVYLHDGRTYQVTDSVSEVEAKIDALWDEFIAALGT